jgi:serine/threonine protein kinase
MHTKNLWILWLGASQNIDYGVHGSQCRKHLRLQYGLMVRCFFLTICLIIPSTADSHQLLEELCLIHKHGVVHGDLRAPNIVLQDGSAHFTTLPISHMDTNIIAIGACRFLLLNLEHPLH